MPSNKQTPTEPKVITVIRTTKDTKKLLRIEAAKAGISASKWVETLIEKEIGKELEATA